MDNPLIILLFLCVELILFYVVIIRQFSWYFLALPSGFFLAGFLIFVVVPGCFNYFLLGWRQSYENGIIYLIVILVNPVILTCTILCFPKRIKVLCRNVREKSKKGFKTHRLVLYAVLFAVGVILYKLFNESALHQLLLKPGGFGEIVTINQLRSDFDVGLKGSIFSYLTQIMSFSFMPMVVLIAYLAYKSRKSVWGMGELFLVIIASSGVSLLSLHKGPILSLFIPVLISVYVSADSGKSRSVRSLVFLFCGLFVLSTLTWIMHQGRLLSDFGELYENLLFRVFVSPSRAIINHIQFAEAEGFRGISVYRILSNLAGMEFTRPANELYLWIYDRGGEINTMNACYIGSAYLGWGILGVAVHSVLLGIFFVCIETMYASQVLSDLMYASLITTSACMLNLVSVDAITFMNTFGGLYLVLWGGILVFHRGFVRVRRESWYGAARSEEHSIGKQS